MIFVLSFKGNSMPLRSPQMAAVTKSYTEWKVEKVSVAKNLVIYTKKQMQSGRLTLITLIYRNGESVDMFGPDFQMGFRLKSNLLTFEISNQGNVLFEGYGFGHGVGMNQTGAKVLAEKYQWTAEQILNFYYNP